MPTTFARFLEVTANVTGGRRLFRSSAPGTMRARGITRVLSLNEQPYTAAARTMLANAGIAYLHLPVEDYHAPTLDQIKRAVTFWSKAPVTNMLVHCGYGYGRTGTMITALQLWMSNGHLGLDRAMTENHVEREEQREVLRCYQAELMSDL
ncbi:protein-tyrosine phosphatase-like protein [Mycena filopes]|nr:protein-tyrosine phosphatase-like protein [Mycena filopes]